MKAVIYARYSSDSQREESIEGQLRECTAFAEKNGITILRHYIDRAYSAKTDNRPEFQNMIKDSSKKLFDMVIVWKLDRFARNRYDSARYKAQLKKNGVKVVSATEVISEGAEGIILESVLEGYAEYYSADLSEKVIRGMTDNALKCKYNGGTLPLGYMIDEEQHFQIDPLTAPFVLDVFKKYDKGATMTELRDWLNECGIRNTRGQSMKYNSVQHILTNRRYIGEFKYRDVIVPDGIPAIVPQDLFDRVQKKLEQNRKTPAHNKAEVEYLLTTKLFCGHCGAYMCGECGKSRNGTVHHYYKCVSVKKKRTNCKKKAVRKQWLEDLVIAEAMKVVMDDKAIEAIVSQTMELQDRENTTLPVLEKELREVESGIQNVLNAIQMGILTKSTKSRLEELETSKEALEIKIANEKISKPRISPEFVTFWLHKFRKLDINRLDHRKWLIQVFVNAIYLYDGKMIITFNYKDGTATITLDDVKRAIKKNIPGSDLDCLGAPSAKHPPGLSKQSRRIFILKRSESEGTAMEPMFISHPDFAEREPLWVYHKQHDKQHFDQPQELQNKHIIYRKKVSLGGFRQAVLRISADDYYKLYINGRYVTEGPASAYHMCYHYNEVDVTDFLHEGENTFAVLCYYHGIICSSYVSGDLRQMFWCHLLVDGETALVSDESWRCGCHTGYSACGLFGYKVAFAERYDARSPETRFYLPEFDDSAFGYAKAHLYPQWQLVKQKTRQLAVYDMEPEMIEKHSDGLFIALPTEAVGSLTFTAQGNPGDTVVIRCGEERNSDGSVRYDTRCNCCYEEFFILSGGVDQMDHYDYKGFRYAQLLFPENVTVTNVKMRVRHYPFTQVYRYPETNEKLKAVLALCVNTIRYGAQDYIMDCPTREKGVYLGDLMVSGRAHAIVTGDTAFLKNAVESFRSTAIICPGLMSISGCSLMQEIADYSLELPALLAWIYSVDGDIQWLREMYPMALGLYEFFAARERSDGLLEDISEKWNLVDWPENLRDGYAVSTPNPLPKGLGVHNVINALWYGCKLAMEEIAQILGDDRDFGAEITKAGFIRAFYREDLGLFTDAPGTDHTAVHSNIFPLLFGLAQEQAQKERLIAFIREKKLTSMGVYMAYFALAALKREGRMDICRELATDDGAWLNMLKEGATTTFEAWGKDQKWNTSLFHPWATAPLIIFADHVRVY